MCMGETVGLYSTANTVVVRFTLIGKAEETSWLLTHAWSRILAEVCVGSGDLACQRSYMIEAPSSN